MSNNKTKAKRKIKREKNERNINKQRDNLEWNYVNWEYYYMQTAWFGSTLNMKYERASEAANEWQLIKESTENTKVGQGTSREA